MTIRMSWGWPGVKTCSLGGQRVSLLWMENWSLHFGSERCVLDEIWPGEEWESCRYSKVWI